MAPRRKRSRKAPQIAADELLLENLTPANIHWITCDLKEHKHDPQDAVRVLHKFCEIVDSRQAIPAELIAHLRHCLGQYLSGGCSLDVAFGLTKGKRGNEFDDEGENDIAAFIWKSHLSGKKLTEAKQEANAKYGPGKDKIQEIWDQRKIDALIRYRLELRFSDPPRDLSKAEIERAEKILLKERNKIDKQLGPDFFRK